MDFEWDESKRQAVMRERGVDMLRAARGFEGKVVTRIDDRADCVEVREISLGLVGDECFVVVHTRRGSAIRLITSWKGGRDERSYYETGVA